MRSNKERKSELLDSIEALAQNAGDDIETARKMLDDAWELFNTASKTLKELNKDLDKVRKLTEDN